MKKLLGILVLGLILFSTSAEAGKKTRFKTGQVYEGTIIYEGGVNINLPDGKWTMLGRWGWSVSAVRADGITLGILEDNILKGLIEMTHVDSGGKWISHVNDWIRSVYIVNKTDGCYERSEYYLVERYKSGAAFNCLVVRHFDVRKEIYNPDKDVYKYQTFKQGFFRVWVRDNNIELPLVMLGSEHAFYAPSVRNKVIILTYIINPEMYGAFKTEFGTEETSEYHRANINRYHDKKKFIENWVKLAAQRHKAFEKDVRAKEIHKLDLSKYGAAEATEETKTKISSSSTTEELKECTKLYKAGDLTKKQFENCKDKVLSQ